MDKIINPQNRISTLLLEFSNQVKLHNFVDRYDINRVSENIMSPLLRLVYGYETKNLNYTHWKNYPGIDLADSENKIAFQITSTSSKDKVVDTLEKVVKYHQYQRYNRFIIYVLTEKGRSYKDKRYAEIIQNRFQFNYEEDIWDYRDLLKAVNQITDANKLKRIQQFLEDKFGKGEPFYWIKNKSKTEELILNSNEINFPEQINIADLQINKDEIIENMKRQKRKIKYPVPDRTLVIEFLKSNRYLFPYDFVCYENKLVTFHDLNDDEHPFRAVIDYGTVTSEPTTNFYNINNKIDENRERVFKDLLRRCLVRMLKKHGIDWQDEENLFIFTMNEQDDLEKIEFNEEKNRYERRINWGRERFVCFRRMKTNKPDEELFYQHLAFSCRFFRSEERWFIQINPNWFFSFDGYCKNNYLNYYLKWLKREEVNVDVKNDFRFILWFFKKKMGDMFDDSFLKFRELKSFSGSPFLDDNLWNPPKETDKENGHDDEKEDEPPDLEQHPMLFQL